MKELDVSVIIGTKGRDSLVGAIKSVLNQTLPPREIVVCFDSAPFPLDTLKTKFESKDLEKIIFLFTGYSSGGPAKPRNLAVVSSTSEFVAFLDDDDIWLPEKLERQITFLEQSNYSGVATNAYIVDQFGFRIRNYFDRKQKGIVSKSGLTEFAIHNPLIFSSVICRRSKVIEKGMFNEAYPGMEDFRLWLKMVVDAPFIYLHEPLIEYLEVNSNSLSNQQSHLKTNTKKVISGDVTNSINVHLKASFRAIALKILLMTVSLKEKLKKIFQF